MLPVALGQTLLFIAKGCALDTIAGCVTGTIVACAAIHLYQRRKARKTLIPIMEDIDRELEALRRVQRVGGN